jgi:outer membrane lipoprotein-sorting protein
MRTLWSSLRSIPWLLCLAVLAPAVHADEKADDLLREVERTTRSVPSLGADMQVTLTTQNMATRPGEARQPRQNNSGFGQGNEPVSFTYYGTVKLQRLNFERIELAEPVHQTIVSDGAFLWTLLPTNEYIKSPADPHGKSPSSYGPILMFFAPETARSGGFILAPGSVLSEDFATRYLGKERVVPKAARGKQEGGGPSAGNTRPEEFDVVEVLQLRPTQQALKLYINADKIVTRVVSETRRGGISTIQDVVLLHVKTAQKFDTSEFAFELPKGARPYAQRPAAPPR